MTRPASVEFLVGRVRHGHVAVEAPGSLSYRKGWWWGACTRSTTVDAILAPEGPFVSKHAATLHYRLSLAGREHIFPARFWAPEPSRRNRFSKLRTVQRFLPKDMRGS